MGEGKRMRFSSATIHLEGKPFQLLNEDAIAGRLTHSSPTDVKLNRVSTFCNSGTIWAQKRVGYCSIGMIPIFPLYRKIRPSFSPLDLLQTSHTTP
jgi:hypothetical protein